ncbi:hypothetical protein SUGI_0497100 [Cryptomeria japonica]|nr:hypothetical protein SUGI_0497100 [Cryptomeria japonica]
MWIVLKISIRFQSLRSFTARVVIQTKEAFVILSINYTCYTIGFSTPFGEPPPPTYEDRQKLLHKDYEVVVELQEI